METIHFTKKLFLLVGSLVVFSFTPPKDFEYFKITCVRSNLVTLDWSSNIEKNGDSFQIYKSKDGIKYLRTVVIPGAGYNESKNDYSYTDKAMWEITYYRIDHLDSNGKLKASITDKVRIPKSKVVAASDIP